MGIFLDIAAGAPISGHVARELGICAGIPFRLVALERALYTQPRGIKTEIGR